MSPFVNALVATAAIGFVELGAVMFIARELWNERTEMRLLSFAAGVLLATIFLDLLPEATASSGHDREVCVAVLAAMVSMFMLERVLQRDHAHSHAPAQGPSDRRPTPSRYFIVIGDGIHSMVDGIVIATAFIADQRIGLITTVAVLAHEVPHQVGDYSILVNGGIPPSRAMLINVSSAAAALAGVGATFALGTQVENHLGLLLGAAAGMLLYITTVSVLPGILHSRLAGRLLHVAPFGIGVTFISTGVLLFPI